MTRRTAEHPPMLNVLIARQLDTNSTGNAAFLMVFLRSAARAGLGVRLVLAPRRSFSNRPWLRLHNDYRTLVREIVWPGSVRMGDWCWSLSPAVWGRFVIRLVKEVLRRTRLAPDALTRVGSLLGDELSPGESRELARACDASPAEVTVAEYSSLGPVLALLRQPTHKTVFLHDLFSLRAEAFRQRGEQLDFRDMTIAEEAARVSAASVLFFASANEMAMLAPLVPGATSIWVRPEVPEYPEVAPQGPPRSVFLGTRHAGNTDAMQTLVDDIWPLVRARVPDAELWIAGSTCQKLTPAQASSPGVKAMGRVDDLASLGGAQSIGLAPTRLASGVSIKVAEYLRLGMPCVAYPVALEGFGPELDDLVDVVPDPESFAVRVAELLADPAGRLDRSRRGRAQSAARLDNSAAVDCLRKLAGSPP